MKKERCKLILLTLTLSSGEIFAGVCGNSMHFFASRTADRRDYKQIKRIIKLFYSHHFFTNIIE